jgi:hypothetical protein
MNKSQKSKSRTPKTGIFLLGSFLFALGIAGTLWHFWSQPTARLSQIFPASSSLFVEFSLDQTTLERWQETFTETDITHSTETILADYLPSITLDKITPWIGNRAGMAFLPKHEFLVATRYRNKRKAEEFLQQLTLADESLIEQTAHGITVQTAAFSSPLAFIFQDGWLLIGSSVETLTSSLTEKNISSNEYYIECAKDFPLQADAIFFAKTQDLLQKDFLGEKYIAQEPLLRALSDTVPAFGITLNLEKDRTLLDAKFVTTNGVFSAEQLKNTPNELLPQMAQFSPRDTFFFMNGNDLYAKFLHTRSFLSDLHPQFSVVFDGLLRAEFQSIFGPEFDFEKDFLSQMRGQYALIFDFEDTASPTPYFTLITGFGNADMEKNIQTLHHVIRSAQSQVATEIVEKKLADGTTREELVAVDPRSVEIRKKQEEERTYFTATSPENGVANSTKKFSYGFLDGQLIFSSHERGVANIMRAFDTANSNLAQNEDFRQSVLFDFASAESFGYINFSKLRTLIDFSQTLITGNEENINWSSFLQPFRNFSFSRKSSAHATYFSGVLRRR